ncbi:MAG: metallophosphoesterase [Acetobacter sp.]|nr:metallophosphoesterase [Bacteroides sp.]MCM1341406.1 metallophosphoesterase [Acetobacter sp.]MCM1433360.1 metallophosphoesterase [Clostridiales bacterium]
MSLFAIADTHLSFGTNKPMDTFTGWENYTEKLQNNWNNLVNEEDTVVIAGDISWAMNFNELYNDFDFINKLNGKKIIIKGNHDYWWNTLTKMNKFIVENDFNTISILHNNAVEFNGFSVCGSRGWLFDSEDSQDEKVLNREIMRVKASIDSAKNDEKIVFLHYPPITTNEKCEEILSLLKSRGIKKCYYGHLHGVAAKFAVDDSIDGIDFKLISADRLRFTPYLVKKY